MPSGNSFRLQSGSSYEYMGDTPFLIFQVQDFVRTPFMEKYLPVTASLKAIGEEEIINVIGELIPINKDVLNKIYKGVFI